MLHTRAKIFLKGRYTTVSNRSCHHYNKNNLQHHFLFKRKTAYNTPPIQNFDKHLFENLCEGIQNILILGIDMY